MCAKKIKEHRATVKTDKPEKKRRKKKTEVYYTSAKESILLTFFKYSKEIPEEFEHFWIVTFMID